jgi:DNA repair protein RecN (Recombination protein N)
MVGVAIKNIVETRSQLEEINIRGLGVIDKALVEFSPGLNVITGETGAGKTMVLTALTLVLGGKTDSDLIRNGSERLSVSGTFSLGTDNSGKIRALCEDHDIEVSDSSIILARSVSRDGKSRALISGASTTATTMSLLGSEFIEIHGQHGNLVLTKPNKQREILDLSGGRVISEKLEKYRSLLSNYLEQKRAITELRKALADRDREIESLRDLSQEAERLRPKLNEFLELDSLISRLESVEDLRVASSGAQQVLSDEELGALNSLHQLKRFLSSAKGKDSDLDAITERANDALFSLIDLSTDLDRYVTGLSADPQALENALTRRAMLSTFIKKYAQSTDKNEALNEVIDHAARAQQRIKDLTGGDDRIRQLESEAQKTRLDLVASANVLTVERQKCARDLSSKVTSELHALSMPKATFSIKVETSESSDDKNFSQSGLDEVAMVFSSHNDGSLLPISKAASGGELSRLMLALEVVIAEQYPLGTYVFDEVDAGVGGKAALEVGRRLRKLANTSQVIVVTHLPQVALWADNHIVVEKDDSGTVTESTIRRISDSDREREIARMLSGVDGSEHAQEHARELLNLRISAKA